MVQRINLSSPNFEEGGEFVYKGNRGSYKGIYKARKRGPRDMIAWDGEGVNLSGMEHPQHYVLFGCSADVEHPLEIANKNDNLAFEEIAEYILDVDKRFPNRWHVGYFFGYDQNMIIRSLHWALKERIHENGRARLIGANGKQYRVRYIPGKSITITRNKPRQTVVIEDMGTFFATSFIKAYTDLFPERVDTPDFNVIQEGKLKRGGDSYEDMDSIRYYWKAEIVAMRDLSERFRDLLWGEGFELRNWSGPGAFANYLRKKFQLAEHEWGGKEDNIPLGVHEAAKKAMFGGRFEHFQLGHFTQKVYGIDRNSAYPDAFCHVPSLREGGTWLYVTEPSSPDSFGIFHVRFRADEAGPITIPSPNTGPDRVWNPPVRRAMPLPYRTKIDTIKYPEALDGWYFTPEVTTAKNAFGDKVQILEGWEWIPAVEDEYPWRDLMTHLFSKRSELKATGNPAQMAYKLGMNCLYGKMAQRIGYKDTMKPPASHTLVIAGYITSYVRARMYEIMVQIPDDDLIAVETDGIYTLTDPATLNISTGLGKALGQWGIDEYDECFYMQNGFYIMRADENWKPPKTRGFKQDLVTPGILTEYLQSFVIGEKWPAFIMESGQRFTSLGASIARAQGARHKQINPIKATSLHCSWFVVPREIDPNGKGKRKHFAGACPKCLAGISPYDEPHPLFITRKLFKDEWEVEGYPLSKSYLLPWEKDYTEPNWMDTNDKLGIGAMLQFGMEV